MSTKKDKVTNQEL